MGKWCDNLLSLQKKRNATYHRRWFILKANLLFYQERPADRHLLGVIVLEGCTVRSSGSDGRFVFSLVFEGLKTYGFAAGDRRTQESWVQALSSASHRYLSLLLRDLRRQYEGVFMTVCSLFCAVVFYCFFLTFPPDF